MAPTIRTPHRPHREHRVPVGGERHLGAAELGDPEGVPVLWFHGMPGGRLQLPPDAHRAAEARGLRLLGVERPGTGWSTAHRYREVRDFADDVRALADALEIDGFGVVGLSGGGPYTLACAHEIPDRVKAAGVIGGAGPLAGKEACPGSMRRLAHLHPLAAMMAGPLAALLPRILPRLAPHAPRAVELFCKIAPEPDRPILLDPEFMEVLVGDILHVGMDGLGAFGHDMRLFTRPWGFELSGIKVPVHFFQGDLDSIVPESHGRHQAGLVEGSELTILEGGGHLAGYIDAGRVFDVLTPHLRSR